MKITFTLSSPRTLNDVLPTFMAAQSAGLTPHSITMTAEEAREFGLKPEIKAEGKYWTPEVAFEIIIED